MGDAIKNQALAAVQNLIGGGMPVRTENNASPVTPQGSQNPGEAPVATFRGTGYLGVDDEPAGSALNPQAQLGLFSKIRSESQWLRYTTFRPVDASQGFIDLWDDRGFRMKPTAKEGPRPNIPLHKPDVSQTQFSTNTLSGAFGLRLPSIRAAAKAGQNVNALVQRGVSAGIANVLADIGVNGNSGLPSDTDENAQRSTCDGWYQKMRDNSPNYQGQANGFGYHNGLWAGMLHQIDKAYRNHPGLAWGLTDTLSSRWLTELSATGSNPSNAHPSIVNNLGSNLLNAVGTQANPLGKFGVIMPQLDDQMWSSDEGYDGIAPTSITDNGDGTLTINVNSLADSGTDRSSTGDDGQRYMVIGCADTGVEEIVEVDYSAPNNTVDTTSLLGQNTASTTASDYYIRWADCQSLFLGPWQYLALVAQHGMRIYTVFYPHDETIEVIIHADIDYVVIDYEATSLVDDLISPQFDILPVTV
jgi:hypothetical protein